MENTKRDRKRGTALQVSLTAVAALFAGGAQAIQLDTGEDWNSNLDLTVQYTLGVRAKSRDNGIGNHAFFHQGDYKFDRGDVVTNRFQGIVELQSVYKGNTGFRISGSAWKDFAYNDEAKTNPNLSMFNSYAANGGKYSDITKRYHIQGGEWLDAFVFHNTTIAEKPVYFKLGRFTQQWGNAFFFGFSNIAYSQHPIDYIKAFSQPGSEVKELFLPRTQVMATAELSPELSVSGQYFFEFRENRYPEGGTYLGSFDILYAGPPGSGALGGTSGEVRRPKDNNGNFGLKATWSPDWAGGDLGFYYREFDEVQPWPLADFNGAGFDAHLSYADKVKLFGVSYERTFGTISTGFEVNYRKNTALGSAFGDVGGVFTKTGFTALTPEGARGNVFNAIANTFVQLGSTSLWDAGVLLAELSYTQLTAVTKNANLFNGVGYNGCPSDYKWDGCSTKRALAAAVLFEPQWLQAYPGVDLSMPFSYTLGIKGNPAYAAGSFYAQGTNIYSLGVKATLQGGKTSVALQYNGYKWRTSPIDPATGAYGGFGGNGPVALNDKGWIQFTVKSSF